MSSLLLIGGWLVELVLLTAAMFHLARRLGGRPLLLLTLTAFVLRLAVGEAFYIVGMFHLPILTSFQFRDGFWTFAPDAWRYHQEAVIAAQALHHGTLNVDFGTWFDPFFWVLGTIYAAFGPNASQGLLLNAAAAALCIPLAYSVARSIGLRTRPALASGAMVAFWPSSFAWSGQIMKDSLGWLALFAITAGVARLLPANEEHRPSVRLLVGNGLLIAAGAALTAVVRGNYMTPLWTLAGVAGAAYLVLHPAVQCLTKPTSLLRLVRTRIVQLAAPLLVMLVALLSGSGPAFDKLGRVPISGVGVFPSQVLASSASAVGAVTAPRTGTETSIGTVGNRAVTSNLAASAREGTSLSPGEATDQPTPSSEAQQSSSGTFLPLIPACRPAASLVLARQGFLQTGGASLVDPQQRFDSCSAIIAYVPRALELTFLAPLPADWFLSGGALGDLRVFGAIDAVLMWLYVPGLVFGLFHALRRPSGATITAIYLMALGLALGFSVANFGTLFRLRLNVILPGAALAVDGWVVLLTILFSKVTLAHCGVATPVGSFAHVRSAQLSECVQKQLKK